jgi:hypothetical protein
MSPTSPQPLPPTSRSREIDDEIEEMTKMRLWFHESKMAGILSPFRKEENGIGFLLLSSVIIFLGISAEAERERWTSGLPCIIAGHHGVSGKWHWLLHLAGTPHGASGRDRWGCEAISTIPVSPVPGRIRLRQHQRRRQQQNPGTTAAAERGGSNYAFYDDAQGRVRCCSWL